MTRVVGGRAGGRRLAVPPGRGTRPTSDRAREALFNTLATEIDLAGAAVLDLYAGSGAVGVEALSRGAGRALLVESDGRAAATARVNLDTVGAGRIVNVRVERLLSAPPEDGPYDLVFADPPYAVPDDEIAAVLGMLADNGWLADGAAIVVERDRRSPGPVWPAEVAALKARTYGDATLWYGRRS